MKTGQVDLFTSRTIMGDVACYVSTARLSGGGFFGWFHVYETAARTFVHKLDHAADLGEEGVILAASYVGPRLNASAALPHNNGAAGDKLPAEGFYAQPLRV